MPEAYRQVRFAMGRGDYADAHRRGRRLFEDQENVHPPLFETIAYLYAYEKQFAQGHAFFDSLLAAGHHRGNVAGAHAILWQTQQQPDSSLEYARQAVLAGSQCVYPYDIFVEKSFELNDTTAASRLLMQQLQLQPENWRLRYSFGIWHSQQNRLKGACDALQNLLEAGIEYWRIYYLLGLKLEDLRKWREALRVLQVGVSYCERIHDDEGLARLLHGRARAEYKLGQWQTAIRTLQQGMQLAQRVGSGISEGIMLLLLGQIQAEQHQWSEAYQNLLAVAQRARQFSEGNLLLQAYYYLADLGRRVGKRSNALDYTFKAYQVADSLEMKEYALLLLNEVGLIDLEAGRYAQALERFEESVNITRSHKADWYLCVNLQNLASCLNALGRYQEALKYWQESDSLIQKIKEVELLLRSKLLHGELLMYLKNESSARALLLTVIDSANNKQLRTQWFHAQILLATMETQEQKHSQAKTRLTQTQAVVPEEIPYETQLKITALLAEIDWQSGEKDRALATYEAALNTIAGQSHRLGPGRLSLLSNVEREIFFNLSRAYMHSGDLDSALSVTERARDLVVKRQRWQARQLSQTQMDSVSARRLAALDSLLREMRLQHATTDSTPLRLALMAKISNLEQEQSTLLSRVLGVNEAPWLEHRPFPLGEFRHGLRSRKELAMSFFISEKGTLVFFIAPDTLQARLVPVGRRELEELLGRIYAGITTENADTLRPRHAVFDTAAAHQVYRLLLHDFLVGRQEKRMAIVPDGVLHALPFDILITAAAQASARPRFLLERFVIRNGSALSELQQQEQGVLRVESFLLAADPVLLPEGGGAAVTQRSAKWRGGSVGRLEAERIRNLVQCEFFLSGESLTRPALLPALQRSDWLHFASHCYAPAGEALHSEFILSIPPRQSEPERIYAFEIFPQSLPLKMAVLSGCETVRGTFVESEGFEGFVQAFRAAGVPSVIASLWKVDDSATAAFFEFYYQAVLAGQSTAAALQTAKLRMLDHGNYNFTDWAAFVHYGDDWRVQLPQRRSLMTRNLLAALIVIILFVMLIWQWRKRAHR